MARLFASLTRLFLLIGMLSCASLVSAQVDADGDGVETPLDCDDGNAALFPGAVCSDGNACTSNDVIDANCQCIGGVATVCDDGNPCTVDSCDPLTGCVFVPAPASTLCDDGNPLTSNDHCSGTGLCIGTIAPPTEICDGLDNDGDGLVDEGNPGGGASCGSSIGSCQPGVLTCVAGILECVGAVDPQPEVCDGIDNNCDGQVDEGNPGGGAACGSSIGACEPGVLTCVSGTLVCVGAVTSQSEVCDGLDNNCNGQVDEGLELYTDSDNDGFGDPSAPVTCATPGAVANNLDCNDNNANIFPGQGCAGCSPADIALFASGTFEPAQACVQNCYSSQLNNLVPCLTNCYVQAGITETCATCVVEFQVCVAQQCAICATDPNSPACLQCQQTSGCAAQFTACSGLVDADLDGAYAPFDCNDNNATMYPDAPEGCTIDGLDNDCDGLVDEDALVDADNDGFTLCTGDCNDTDDTINPNGIEVCDGADNDCDGSVDEGFPVHYHDLDGDGSGDPNNPSTCNDPTSTTDNTDCDDADPTVYLGAPEICDGLDNDCNGIIDDDLDNDTDNDGFSPCMGDCDDQDDTVFPGAPELCDGLDNDCNGAIELSIYADLDGDGYGDAANQLACGSTGATNDDDCDDTDPLVTLPQGWFVDADGDGYGASGAPIANCTQPMGAVGNSYDCDDTDANIFPGQGCTECSPVDLALLASNPFATYPDQQCITNCNSAADPQQCLGDCIADNGLSPSCADCFAAYQYCLVAACPVCQVDPGSPACQQCIQSSTCGIGFSDCSGLQDADNDGSFAPIDCDDNNAAVYPGAVEICDAFDNDCDGGFNEGLSGGYADNDGDGYGNPLEPLPCDTPGVADNTDCDDGDANAFPGQCPNCTTANRLWILQNQAMLDGIAGSMLLQCNSSGDLTGCLASAIVQSTPLPYSCATCVAQRYGCLVQTCLAPCIGGFQSPNCLSCMNLNCNTVYLACAGFVDADGDGVFAEQDCDDTNAMVHSGASDANCDGLDNDCDGAIDEDALAYPDLDGDGAGDANALPGPCGPNMVANNDDCDDTDSTSFPGASDPCDIPDGADNDCDGAIDNGVLLTYYTDGDADGWGDDATGVTSCSAILGAVTSAGDCDDGDPLINPAMDDLPCDGIDNDCDGAIDNGAALSWYQDTDGDGFGCCVLIEDCTQPLGYVALTGDCDDGDATVHPGATELCDGIDQACDGGNETWYPDLDLDLFGDDTGVVLACVQPSGYISVGGDCDDTNDQRYPGGPVLCPTCSAADLAIIAADPNFLDNVNGSCALNCMGSSDPSTCWADCIEQSSGLEPACASCFAERQLCLFTSCPACVFDPGSPACQSCLGTTTCNTDFMNCSGLVDDDSDGSFAPADCDDNNPAVRPNAPETCDGLDNDCDGLVDEGLTFMYYTDADGDGFGADGTGVAGDCDQPPGTATLDGDCDDTDDSSFPGAPELCDGIDNDCNGATDDGAGTFWYADLDGDGFGGSPLGNDCVQPPNSVSTGGDCNDTDGAVNPGAPDPCDAVDQNCDGTGFSAIWYADADADGFGDVTISTTDCAQPVGFVANAGDCDDTDGNIFPGTGCAACAPGESQWIGTHQSIFMNILGQCSSDCFGSNDPNCVTACMQTSGVPANAICLECVDGFTACTQANCSQACLQGPELCAACQFLSGCYAQLTACLGQVDTDGDGAWAGSDCDDDDAALSPFAIELCDGLDNNCNGIVDEGLGTDYFLDGDLDGFGDIGTAVVSCTPVAGRITTGGDCDDSDPLHNPNTPELCNGLDDNCNGFVDEGLFAIAWHADTDGDGLGDPQVTLTNCAQPSGYVANNLDCDDTNYGIGLAQAWFPDDDGDGFGNPGNLLTSCTPIAGRVTNGLDCNDADGTLHPGVTEVCNGVDDDCDGGIDEGLADGTPCLLADPCVIFATYSNCQCMALLVAPDSDNDGFCNLVDGCPNDPLKTAPGICGCGSPDIDSDGDGTMDCIDICPNDPLKIAPGICGCGVVDDPTDSDNDGAANCSDACPNDPNKIAPGACGCGIADTDLNNNGVCDDQESFPNLQLGVVATSTGQLEVRLLAAADFAGIFSAYVVTLRWPTTPGVSVTGSSAAYVSSTMEDAAGFLDYEGTTTGGIYSYATFLAIGSGNPLGAADAFLAGVEKPLFRVPVVNNTGACVDFEVVNDAFQDGNNLLWYASLGGNERSNGYIPGKTSAKGCSTALCQNVSVGLDAFGNASVTAAQVNTASLVNCDAPGLALSPSAFTCAQLGANPVTLTVTYASGYAPTCAAIVTVFDPVAPVLTPGPIASCFTTTTAAEAAAIAATNAVDNCNGTLSFSASTTGTCSAVVTVIVTDPSGNSTSIPYATRIDNTAPVVSTLPGSLDGTFLCTHTAEINAALALAPTATDDCVLPVTLNLVSDITTGVFCDQVRTRVWNFTDDCGNTSATFTQTITLTPVVQFHPRVILDGAYVEATDRMTDDLRVANLIPTAQPYSAAPFSYAGTETVSPSVLAMNDPDDAIVDWVLVELRDNSTPTTVIGRRAALVQRDGDVVDTDGTSPVDFGSLPFASYRVVMKHRNHFGAMTNTGVALSSTPVLVDFTLPALTTHGTNAQKPIGGRMVLWGGNALIDNKLRYTGATNDRDVVLVRIGGLVATNVILNVYTKEDTNLDTKVKYTGAENDREIMLINVNHGLPGISATRQRFEQLP